MSLYNGEASVVCPSVRLSVNFCANRFFSQANGRIATKLAHDGHQVSLHPGCVCSRSRSKVTWYAHFLGFLGMSYSVIDGLVNVHFTVSKNDNKIPVGRLEGIAPTTFWPWGRSPPWNRRLCVCRIYNKVCRCFYQIVNNRIKSLYQRPLDWVGPWVSKLYPTL